MIKRVPERVRSEPSRDSPFKEGVAAWLFQFREPDDGTDSLGTMAQSSHATFAWIVLPARPDYLSAFTDRSRRWATRRSRKAISLSGSRPGAQAAPARLDRPDVPAAQCGVQGCEPGRGRTLHRAWQRLGGRSDLPIPQHRAGPFAAPVGPHLRSARPNN